MLENEINIVNDYICHGEYCPSVQEAWQNLKQFVLAQQQSNKQGLPCDSCESTDCKNCSKCCPNCGMPI